MIAWLLNLRLSLQTWALVCITALCGGLVVALSLQGSRLHKAQIDALSARIDLTNAAEEDKIKALQLQMEVEIHAYEQAH